MKQVVEFNGSSPTDVEGFVVEARLDFKPFRRVVISPEGTVIFDINRNEIRFPGVSYHHPLLLTVLKVAGASFDPVTVHEIPPSQSGQKELRCSARYAWGQDRIA